MMFLQATTMMGWSIAGRSRKEKDHHPLRRGEGQSQQAFTVEIDTTSTVAVGMIYSIEITD